jgi:hypothetical protein
MSVAGGPNLIKNGLVLELDAGNIKSYQSGSTTWFDKSGNNLNGTLINGPTFNTGSGGSIVFDGVDDYVGEPYTSLLNLGTQFSICSFVKLGNTSQIMQPIFGAPDVNFGVNTQGYFFYWYRDSGNGLSGSALRLQFGQSNWQWNLYGSNGNTITNTNWHYVCVTTSGLNTSLPTVTFYVDGINVGSNYWNAASKAPILYSSNTGSIRVNSVYFPSRPTYDGPYYLTGNTGVVQLYNKELSAQEVLQNYNAQKSRFGLT